MKLHLPKSLFVAVMAACSLGSVSQAANTWGSNNGKPGEYYYFDQATFREIDATNKGNRVNLVADKASFSSSASITVKKDSTLAVCGNPWSPYHVFNHLLLTQVDVVDNGSIALEVNDGVTTTINKVVGALSSVTVSNDSKLILGTSAVGETQASTTTFSGTITNSGSLTLKGDIVVTENAVLSTGYAYTGKYTTDDGATESTNGFAMYDGTCALIVQGRGATVEADTITYKGQKDTDLKHIAVSGCWGVYEGGERGVDKSIYGVMESETLESSKASTYILADTATLTFTDVFVYENTVTVKGNGTVVASIGNNKYNTNGSHGNILHLGKDFNGILELKKGAVDDENLLAGKVELCKYTNLGDDAKFKLTSGEHWSNGDTISRAIILNGTNEDDFVFNHQNTLTLSGEVTGTHLYSNSGINLTNSATSIQNVKLTKGELGVDASMTLEKINVPGLRLKEGVTLTIGDGTKELASTAGTMTLEGNGSTLNILEKGSLTVTGVVSGGKLTKDGAGTLTLSGANTYTGGTEIKGGTLKLGSAGALGSGVVEVGTGAVLDVNGQAVTSISGVTLNAGAKLANSGANIWATTNQLSGITLLGDATIEATGAFGLVKSGEATSLNLNGHTLTKDGTGNFALMSTTVDGNGKIAIGEGKVLVGYKDAGGASSLSASGTTVELTDSGSFELENKGSSATIAALTGTGGYVVNNGVIELTGTDDYSFAAAVSGSGSIKVTGAGTHTYTGSSLANSIELAANSGFEFASDKDVAYENILSGSGEVTKTGAGTLTLSGANTYSGGTAINGGVLVADNASALGTGPVTIGGGTLKLNQALTLGSLTYTSGEINLNGKTLTVTGALTSNNAKPTIAGGEGSVLAVKGNLAVTGDSVGDGFHLQLAQNSKATVELYGKDNQVGIVDFSAGGVTGTLSLKSGSSTTITNEQSGAGAGALWLSSTSKVLLEDTAKLTFCGTTVTGKGSGSSITNTAGKNTNVTLWDNVGEVKNADIEVTKSFDGGVIEAKLTQSTLKNSTEGKITLNNSENTLTALNAAKGDITLQNTSKQELSTLAIAAGKTVAVYTGTDTANVGTLTVSGTGSTATFGAGATLNSNLVLGTGAELTLSGVLTLGGTLTLSEGLTLNYGAAVTAIATLAEDTNQVVLFTGVDKLYLGSNAEASGILTSADKVDISTYLTSDAFKSSETGDYYLGYDGSDVYVEFVAKADEPEEDPSTPEGGGNVPEPTTGALSLLGLAALAMRRRRRA